MSGILVTHPSRVTLHSGLFVRVSMFFSGKCVAIVYGTLLVEPSSAHCEVTVRGDHNYSQVMFHPAWVFDVRVEDLGDRAAEICLSVTLGGMIMP